ncbi:MAG: HDIG domain-containing protein [Candidatus Brocadiae bacterium]|nr:HDIG domain-containing protein [Candidatus Brocadiia bacterium]
MARARTPGRRRLSLERLGIQPRPRRALVPSVTLADVVVAAAFLLAVVVALQYDVLVALAAGKGKVLEALGGRVGALQAVGGTGVVVVGLGVLGWLGLLRMRRTEPGSWRHLLVFGACTLACVIAARVLVHLDAQVAPRWRSLVYLTPVSAFAILLSVVFGQRRAATASLLLALLAGLAVHVNRRTGAVAADALPVVVVLLCGALVAVLGSARIRHRVKLLAVGLLVGLAQVGALVGFSLVSGSLQLDHTAPPEILWAFLNGLGVGVAMTVLLPFVEVVFNVTTDIRLLELSDQEHPLLRSLVTLAPSTDHHSRRAALLAEAAAEAIGANPLIARVGAYYHDIGKMVKPGYFIENLASGESPHDRLRPTMSTLIIGAHTKDGVELAEEARLPHPIVDIVAQHHGTSVIEFFYNRHLEESASHGQLDESFFRYPGPKPRTREAAIVLLADAVEAASRTLAEPLPSRIRTLIKRISSNKLRDGQLEESRLTLSELHAIEQTFFRVLCSMHHARIEYPNKELDAAGRRR